MSKKQHDALAQRVLKYLDPETQSIDLEKVLPVLDDFDSFTLKPSKEEDRAGEIIQIVMGYGNRGETNRLSHDFMPLFGNIVPLVDLDNAEKALVISRLIASLKDLILEILDLRRSLDAAQCENQILDRMLQTKGVGPVERTRRLLS